jgi:hypothetical protein
MCEFYSSNSKLADRVHASDNSTIHWHLGRVERLTCTPKVQRECILQYVRGQVENITRLTADVRSGPVERRDRKPASHDGMRYRQRPWRNGPVNQRVWPGQLGVLAGVMAWTVQSRPRLGSMVGGRCLIARKRRCRQGRAIIGRLDNHSPCRQLREP